MVLRAVILGLSALVVAALLMMTMLAARAPASPHTAGAEAAVGAHGHFAGLVDIGGGRRIYLKCRGSGSPTVVLESGLRTAANMWSLHEPRSERTPVFPGIARFTRVCAYDRPNTIQPDGQPGRSDPVPMPRTAADAVADLHALLRAADIPGPYVLAGHSFGGLIVRLYASTYPRKVSGLVLVDALSEKLKPLLGPERWSRYVALLDLPPPGLEGYRDLETIDWDASAAQMRRAAAARPLRATLPLVVLSKGQSFGAAGSTLGFPVAALDRAWRMAQDRLAKLVPHARHVVVRKSGHEIPVERPHPVIKAVRQVLGALRPVAVRCRGGSSRCRARVSLAGGASDKRVLIVPSASRRPAFPRSSFLPGCGSDR